MEEGGKAENRKVTDGSRAVNDIICFRAQLRGISGESTIYGYCCISFPQISGTAHILDLDSEGAGVEAAHECKNTPATITRHYSGMVADCYVLI